MSRAKGALKIFSQIIFVGEIRHVGTHMQLSNKSFPEKNQILTPKNLSRSPTDP